MKMAGRNPGHFCFVIARSASDEAIHSSFTWRDGLLRFARNDAERRFESAPPVQSLSFSSLKIWEPSPLDSKPVLQ
jgi:hypothetical protein